ncbi:PREDICTED: pancreatic triacylglycerol lipase-like [Dinoponera quadriceps]|uniref:phospholipase A1 n=1 Tax=Dinoponera quadriceps TaxID=609295 RepID=A0A6P3XLK5_DINQU|nr:PREDICTED: pancreatic triacylglycerol lipase-like [Dinoponera quadriceps]
MVVNEMLLLARMANIMVTLNATANTTAIENISTTTLSPEEKENRFDMDDKWNMWQCYAPYGCFYKGSPWSGTNRPVSAVPIPPDVIKPRYLLYTRENEQYHKLKIDNFQTIKKAPLKKDKTLYFIIHGFLENGDKTAWISRLIKELLIREDCNIVVVNWMNGAEPPYTQAVANTRLVGAMTARLASQLINVGGIAPEKMHVIGHSLGGHTAGYVGYYLRTDYNYNLGRITGLDPAEPQFSNTSPLVRLDPTDATFVTAIHTDGVSFMEGGLGIVQPVAHIDFYPNGGNHQPGCNEGVINSITREDSFFRGIKKFLSCNHVRSYEYFIESINSPCPFLAMPCSSWEKFQEGGCFDCKHQYCPRLGLDAQPGNYDASVYLMTGESKPYCKAHYKITINISKTNESVSHGGEVGMFVVHVIGANGKKTEGTQLSSEAEYYEPGSTHTVVFPGNFVGKPQSVEIIWEYQTSILNPLTWRLFHTPRVYIDSLTIKNLETDHSVTLCPDESKTLFRNKAKILTVDNCRVTKYNNIVST